MFYPFDRAVARFLKACLALFWVAGGFGYLLLMLFSDIDKDGAAVLFVLLWVPELLLAFLYLAAGKRGIVLTQDALHIQRLLSKRKVLPSEIGCICIVGWGPHFSTDHLTGYKIGIMDASFEPERMEAFGPGVYINRTNNADGALLAAVSYHAALMTELMSRYSCPIYVTNTFAAKFPEELERMRNSQWQMERRDGFCVLRK